MEDLKSFKHELQDLIQGKSGIGETDFISQIAYHLRTSKEAGSGNKGEEYTKQQEEKVLIEYINERG